MKTGFARLAPVVRREWLVVVLAVTAGFFFGMRPLAVDAASRSWCQCYFVSGGPCGLCGSQDCQTYCCYGGYCPE